MKGEYFNARHAEALEALEKLKAEYEQLQRWHRESITYAEKVKAAENALAEERKDHSETRDALRAVRIQVDSLKESPKPSRAMHDLAENMARAAKKHPGPHANIMVTLGVLSQEMHELQEAVHSREERAIRAELIDVATSALRGVEALDERAEARRASKKDECATCTHEYRAHCGPNCIVIGCCCRGWHA